MVDIPPQTNDEQYPLLKVESGGGDSGRTPALAAASGYNVACSPKRPWFDRWPELISACWMTGMLLSIFILIFYGLGTLGVIRKQPIFAITCNSTNAESEVHFHYIVQRGERVPFSRFSEYLANVASQYSSLYFNVFFLIDDSMQFGYRGQRHSSLMNRLLPYQAPRESGIYDGINQRELRDFHLKYQNVNITIMHLTKFMAMTPLRYKWRTIPIGYLTFYARVFSVWKNGGIGIDLDTFSILYNRHLTPDRRITAILKQYNKGVKPEVYANTLKNIDRDEQNEFLSMFYGIVHQILNETRGFFNRSLTWNQETSSEPIVRTHRNKRDMIDTGLNTSLVVNGTVAVPKTKLVNTTHLTIFDDPYQNTDLSPTVKNMASTDKVPLIGDINVNSLTGNVKHANKSVNSLQVPNRNGSEGPKVILLYDFSIFSDNIGPPYAFPSPMPIDSPLQSNTEDDDMSVIKTRKTSYFLSITIEGSFIAAVSKQHPFLAHLISAGCQRMHPKYAIQDAIVSQCSSILNDDVYCSNIYVF